MLYSLTVLIAGIFLGQEYVMVPSVKILATNLIVYLQNLKNPTEIEIEIDNQSYFKRFFWW